MVLLPHGLKSKRKLACKISLRVHHPNGVLSLMAMFVSSHTHPALNH
jgi:hypothetical protein